MRATVAERLLETHQLHKHELAAAASAHETRRAHELEELHARYAHEYAHITRMVVSRLGLAVH